MPFRAVFYSKRHSYIPLDVSNTCGNSETVIGCIYQLDFFQYWRVTVTKWSKVIRYIVSISKLFLVCIVTMSLTSTEKSTYQDCFY